MSKSDKRADIRNEFPGDEALEQVHLARKALLAAASRRKLTLGAYVRSLNLRPKSSTRA